VQVLEKYPLLLTETLSLSGEYALIGHILDLYDNILTADFEKNKVNKARGFGFRSGLDPIFGVPRSGSMSYNSASI